ncbi:homoserine O- acetyltransferase [Coemansia thaxteri]|uniref:Homoserine O- acetyltransferase n=1 Tax=Coemansia thaxteri TaxID=2663907 RepID=A0A9W8BP67_9FUNG|nr:homoserine O- acetyltransferase [Coemansia thaxteri]KAJ2007458.1 homoserine O- acetyltransferase [Coemansia thaxteri]KAJ2472417.1 homoserine O- acetyltransferase [Coemansia sp. RSA 2322]KAJ2486983.1 homoserine O- acetyltransferase [Coemansia sp. RSA 2320]
MVAYKVSEAGQGASNSFTALVQDQRIMYIPTFELESGDVLRSVPVAYKTWGALNEQGNNCMVICHALTGSSDVADWWGPLLGSGRAFDTSRFFVVCCNVLGSPYGTASPLTTNPDTGASYGPEFPLTSIRDDVRLHRLVLDALGVQQVAICIGGSLGGMQCLEWGMLGSDYVRVIVPIATCGKHSAWGISWGEAQRQAIYSDPSYNNGHYSPDKRPDHGLSTARMSALLTYRSRDSFESRFGRKMMTTGRVKLYQSSSLEAAALTENAGSSDTGINSGVGGNGSGAQTPRSSNDDRTASSIFSAQSYLRYQGDKFTKRFDANCYIAITRKMDTHDVGHARESYVGALGKMKQPALVVGIESDGLFTISEQYELAEHIPLAQMATIDSADGHDGFLLEFAQLNRLLRSFVRDQLPEFASDVDTDVDAPSEFTPAKTSVFGEAEAVDVMQW